MEHHLRWWVNKIAYHIKSAVLTIATGCLLYLSGRERVVPGQYPVWVSRGWSYRREAPDLWVSLRTLKVLPDIRYLQIHMHAMHQRRLPFHILVLSPIEQFTVHSVDEAHAWRVSSAQCPNLLASRSDSLHAISKRSSRSQAEVQNHVSGNLLLSTC
jgi:hypothetical protein